MYFECDTQSLLQVSLCVFIKSLVIKSGNLALPILGRPKRLLVLHSDNTDLL